MANTPVRPLFKLSAIAHGKAEPLLSRCGILAPPRLALHRKGDLLARCSRLVRLFRPSPPSCLASRRSSREAGEIALELFPPRRRDPGGGQPQALRLAGHRSRPAHRPFPARPARASGAGARLALRGNRRFARSAWAARRFSSSIRSTARAASLRATPVSPSASLWSSTASPSSAGPRPGARRNFSRHGRRRRAPQRRAIAVSQRRETLPARGWRRPTRSAADLRRSGLCLRGSRACPRSPCACCASPTANSTRRSPARTPTTGILPPPTSSCMRLAASLTDFAGRTPLYNRAEPRHPALAAGPPGLQAELIGGGDSAARAAKHARRLDEIDNEIVEKMTRMSHEVEPKQLLHLVFGGELKNLATTDFKDLSKIDLVGMYPDFKSAHAAWKAKAQVHGGQCADALFHRPSAPRARPLRRLISPKAPPVAARLFPPPALSVARDEGLRRSLAVTSFAALRAAHGREIRARTRSCPMQAAPSQPRRANNEKQ